MKMIVGLGNPGNQYKNTLHNVGFQVLDLLAEKFGALQWQRKFKGESLSGRLGDKTYVLLKPMTYMNISGESVLACKQFYKLELNDILVVSDDIDRPVGTLRYRTSGGHGGHNGLRSIMQLCGGNEFHRIKVGIGRPASHGNIAGYVLSKPSTETEDKIRNALEYSIDYLMDFIKDITIQIQPKDQDTQK